MDDLLGKQVVGPIRAILNITTPVAAAASVPSSFTSTNALWTMAEMKRSPLRPPIPVKSARLASNASVIPNAARVFSEPVIPRSI